MNELELSTNTIDLRLDEENELTFEVTVQGSSSTSPIYRFVCESEDMSFVFRGIPVGENQVQVIIPPLEKKIKEGIHDAHLEVIVENKLFVPMQLSANFKVSTRVVAEGVRVNNKLAQAKSPSVTVSSAKIINDKESAVVEETVKHENPLGKTLAQVYERQKNQARTVRKPKS